uniref:Uncharacterized protein n=1 Tax=Arundo donax TaxID=35708 RepID=A0A0A8ZJH6_ARUDO
MNFLHMLVFLFTNHIINSATWFVGKILAVVVRDHRQAEEHWSYLIYPDSILFI